MWAAVLNPGFHLPAVFHCTESSPGRRKAVTVLQRKAINLCESLKIHFSFLLFLSSKKGLVCDTSVLSHAAFFLGQSCTSICECFPAAASLELFSSFFPRLIALVAMTLF